MHRAPSVPAPYDQRIDECVSGDDDRAEQDLDAGCETCRVQQGHDVVFDEACVVTLSSREMPQVVFERRERTESTEELNASTPRCRGHVDPRAARPAQREQSAEHDECHECRVREQYEDGEDPVHHVRVNYVTKILQIRASRRRSESHWGNVAEPQERIRESGPSDAR